MTASNGSIFRVTGHLCGEFYVDTNTDVDTNSDTNIRLLLAENIPIGVTNVSIKQKRRTNVINSNTDINDDNVINIFPVMLISLHQL